MTLIHQILLDSKNKASSLILICLAVATNWTPEVPQIILPVLKLLQSRREQVDILNLSIHEGGLSPCHFTTFQGVLQVALSVWQLEAQ